MTLAMKMTAAKPDCGEYFAELGRLVEDRWSAHAEDCARFPEVACAALTDLPPPAFTPGEVLTFIRRQPTLPRQVNIDFDFGEPGVCVYYHPRFYIETLFWLNGTTAIHQHRFSGAFHVLAGSSIHTRYAFRPQDRVNERLILGSLDFQDAELLKVGQFRPIVAGPDFIHALFHLDRPSVTMVVRTSGGAAEAGQQFNYLPPGLASDPFVRDERAVLLGKTLGILLATDRAAYLKTLEEVTLSRDFALVLTALEHANDDGVPEDQLEALIDRARRRHGERASILGPVFAEKRRLTHLTTMRKHVVDRDHRFFLALLLNVPRRDLVAKLVRTHYPDRDPEDVITTWVEQLSAITIPPEAGVPENPLGARFGEADTIIFRHLFAGSSRDHIIERLRAADYDVDGQEGMIDRFCHALQSSVIFRPLFA